MGITDSIRSLFPSFTSPAPPPPTDQSEQTQPSTFPPTFPDDHQLPPCKYDLSEHTTSTLVLPSGRTLAYAQYRSYPPAPPPNHNQHGLPGSRLEASVWDSLGKKHNARFISHDRPGYGLSSPDPNPARTPLDTAADVNYLANHLGLTAYSVMGISGGGPSALACAKALPAEKLHSVCVIVGLGPPDIGMRGAQLVHYHGFTWGWRYASPAIMRWFFRLTPDARTELTDAQRFKGMWDVIRAGAEKGRGNVKAEKDGAYWDDDVLLLHLRSQRESYRQGFEATTRDGASMCSPWGFRLEDIRKDLRFQLWYGGLDVFVPPNHGVQIARRLRGEGESEEEWKERVQLRIEDETHASIQKTFREEIVRRLVEGVREGK
jgi:pimeloyl-ACP methyl ester carboxylesterase